MKKGAVAAVFAAHINKRMGLSVSGQGIMMLDLIKRNYPNTKKEDIIKKTKLDSDLVDFILSGLEKDHLSVKGSPWVVTKKGEKILEEFHKSSAEIEKAIESDPLFKQIADNYFEVVKAK